jgi:hypothetical protein
VSKTFLAGLDDHLTGTVTSIAECTRIIRPHDGAVFAFTTVDIPLPIDIGDGRGVITHVTGQPFERDALTNNDELAVNNMQVVGYFDTNFIDELELERGLFDGAVVQQFIVNWKNLAHGIGWLQSGTLGEVILTPSGKFTAEFRGLTQKYNAAFVQSTSPLCRTVLGTQLGNSFRPNHACTIPLNPNKVGREVTYAVGDVVRATSLELGIPTTITNPDANIDVTGWTVTAGGLIQGTTTPDPFEGAGYFESTDVGETRAHQDLTVPVGQEAGIDAGLVVFGVEWQFQTGTGGDTTEMEVEFFDGGMSSRGARVGSGGVSSNGAWFQGDHSFPIPPLARTVRLSMHFNRGGGVMQGYIDDIVAGYQPVAPTPVLSEDFDNRIYRCTVAGKTSPLQPTYNTGVASTTVDGSATFTTELSWARFIEVVLPDPTDTRRKFTVAELTPNSGAVRVGFPAPYFRLGVVVWETGLNTFLSMEVKIYTPDDGVTIIQTIELFENMPFDVAIGDKARIYPGCDLTFSVCKNTFANGKNFQGEKDLPGEDAIRQTPDAKN